MGIPSQFPAATRYVFKFLLMRNYLIILQQRIKFPFHGSLVLQTFAHHLNITKGSKWDPGLKHTCPTTRPYGGLVLATIAVGGIILCSWRITFTLFLQVKRALSLWAKGRVTVKAVHSAYAKAKKGRTKATIQFEPVINKNTGVASTAYAAFSQVRWKDDTEKFMASAVALTDEEFDVIIDKAQVFVKATNRGNGDSESAPSNPVGHIHQPVEVSDDEAEEQWVPKLCKSHSHIIGRRTFSSFLLPFQPSQGATHMDLL